MTVRPVAGLSRVGLRTADGCFFPLMLDSFRGVREVVLTTADAEQDTADVELFLEEPGGGEGYQHLGTVHLEETTAGGPGRPDLVLRVSLDAGRVLTATVTGPAGRGERRIALQRYTSGDATLHTPARLAGVREVVDAGHLHGEPHRMEPAATAWRAAGASAEADAVQPIERFVHRCTSVLPLNAAPDDRARILWLVERPDLSRDEADLLRSICHRMAGDRDQERAGFAQATMRFMDELTADATEDHDTAASGDGIPAAEMQAAYGRRDYGEVLRLLHAGREAGVDPGIPAELAAYWLAE